MGVSSAHQRCSSKCGRHVRLRAQPCVEQERGRWQDLWNGASAAADKAGIRVGFYFQKRRLMAPEWRVCLAKWTHMVKVDSEMGNYCLFHTLWWCHPNHPRCHDSGLLQILLTSGEWLPIQIYSLPWKFHLLSSSYIDNSQIYVSTQSLSPEPSIIYLTTQHLYLNLSSHLRPDICRTEFLFFVCKPGLLPLHYWQCHSSCCSD